MKIFWGCMGLFLIATMAPQARSAPSEVSTGKVYDSVEAKKVLFTVHREDQTDGQKRTSVETFTDPQGAVAVRTEAVTEGGNLRQYAIHENQTHENGKVTVNNGRVYFEYTDGKGRTKKDDEKLEGNLVVGLTLRDFVQKNWKSFLDGKSVDMRFAVPERQETVGFKMFKDKELDRNGTKVVVLEMKPSSFVIAALVKPLYFFYDRSSGKLIEINGRTLPKLKDGDSWKDLDAATVFD